jgi:hypothetical protein
MKKTSLVLRNYHAFDTALPAFAIKTNQGLKNNPGKFPPAGIPIVYAAMATLISEDQSTYADWKAGGLPEELLFNTARGNLMAGLDSNADHVDVIADGDAAIIKLSGYSASSVDDVKAVKPTQPLYLEISTGGTMPSGEMDAECETIDGATSYGCIVCEGGELPAGCIITPQGQLVTPIGTTNRIIHDLNKQRKKNLVGLTKGLDYYFYFYAVNAAGVGVMSVYKMKMCS